MRRQVLLVLTVLVLGGVAFIAMVRSGAVSSPTQEVSAQGPPHVLVNVSCSPQSGNGPLNITVNPWLYTRKQGDDVEWKLNITGSDDNRIEIRAKDDWPFATTTFTGNGNARNREPMTPSSAGIYSYDISIYCGEEKVVLDPRMKIDE